MSDALRLFFSLVACGYFVGVIAIMEGINDELNWWKGVVGAISVFGVIVFAVIALLSILNSIV